MLIGLLSMSCLSCFVLKPLRRPASVHSADPEDMDYLMKAPGPDLIVEAPKISKMTRTIGIAISCST